MHMNNLFRKGLVCGIIYLMIGAVFSGLINTVSATDEKLTISVTDPSPWFTKGSYSGHPEYWNYYPDEYEPIYIWTYVGGTSDDPSEPDCWAEFRPYLSQDGEYDVYACFYADLQNSHIVPHTICYDGGSTTILVDQYASDYFTWREVKLGTWNFNAGADTCVVVTDATGESYDGYTTLNVGSIMFLQSVQFPPDPPTILCPGLGPEPGHTINTLTPTFVWRSVSNADYYSLYVSKYPYGSGNIVFDSEIDYGPLYGTSFTLPGGILNDGEQYRWNMRAYNSEGWSDFSTRLYFVVNTLPSPDIVYVDDDYDPLIPGWGHDRFNQIQYAINRVQEKGTVHVYNGIYYENIWISKTINLIGEDKDMTIIDGSNSGDVVHLAANWVNITGFKIRNSGSSWGKGLKLFFHSSYNTISGNIISNNFYGIRLEYSMNNIISGNIISNNDDGINLASTTILSSSNNVITGNSISSNNRHGIMLSSFSNSNIITKNDISWNNNHGIYVHSSSNNIISGNIISNNDNGINIYTSYSLPDYSSNNNIITGNNISLNNYGIWLSYFSNHNTITGNNISSNNEHGIYLRSLSGLGYSSNDNTISGNIISNNYDGILISSYCENNTISGNIILNNRCGIYLHYNSNNSIIGNIVRSSTYYGICLSSSSNIVITGNSVSSNNYIGIFIGSSSYNSITGNNISSNNICGIKFSFPCNNNVLYHNNFIDNTPQNAYDQYLNVWDNGYPSGGNYWSDFDEPSEGAYDNNGDGIVDTPYQIPGSSNQDNYPLITPWGGGNQPPNPPEVDDLNQYDSAGSPIDVGGTVYDGTVFFKCPVSDPDNDKVQLQVELRRLDELGGSFDENAGGLKESALVPSGSKASCDAQELIPSDYHWRARTIDEHGEVSEWISFGNNPDPDFDFLVPKILPVPYYYQDYTDWCVPTSMSMIFHYFGIMKPPWHIASYWGVDENFIIALGDIDMAREYFKSWGLQIEESSDNNPTFNEIKSWIDAGKPILTWVKWWEIHKHAVVITGYSETDESQNVYIHDPSSLFLQRITGKTDYPYWASVDLDEVYSSGTIYHVMAVQGTPCLPKGSIDYLHDYLKSSYYPITFQDTVTPKKVYCRYSKEAEPLGLIWESNNGQSTVIDSDYKLNVKLTIVNHMNYDQTYLLSLKFASHSRSYFHNWTKTVPKRSYDQFGESLPLRDIVKETGEYLISLTLSDTSGIEVYDKIIHPTIFYIYPINSINFIRCSPVDIYITDPDGLHAGIDPFTWELVDEIPGTVFGGSLLSPWIISIPERKVGDYYIDLIPNDDASPTDTYSLEVHTESITIVLADNIQIINMPEQPYIIRSTETEIMQIIPATIDIDPDTLNLNSGGNWITCYIELLDGYGVADIDIGTILLNDVVPAEDHPTEIGDYDNNGIPDLMVKFDRQAVQDILGVGNNVAITVTGELTDGTRFDGTDYIKVI